MTPTNEAAVLAHMVDRTRQYTLFYFNLIKDQDLHRRFVCEGTPLNTAYWLIAHLATTQNALLLRCTGGPFQKFSWAKHYSIGGAGLPPNECPPFEEVMATFNEVHQKAMDHLPTLGHDMLESPNISGMTSFGTTTRDVITHAIRHEGSHIGHLGWLCKLYGVKTM